MGPKRGKKSPRKQLCLSPSVENEVDKARGEIVGPSSAVDKEVDENPSESEETLSPVVLRRKQREPPSTEPTSMALISLDKDKTVLYKDKGGDCNDYLNDESSSMGVFDIIKGGEVLKKCRMLDVARCLLVPLCRLHVYPKVRGLRKDYSQLKVALEGEMYCPEKGIFILSVVDCAGVTMSVTRDILKQWDPIWHEVNNEFEQELSKDKSLAFMSNHMFYVWEGNHRTVAWMELISSKYTTNKDMHLRVLSTLIDPRKLSEVALLASLQRMNEMNEHAVMVTNLRDILINTANICGCDMNAFLKEQDSSVARLLESKKKKEAKASSVWYPLARDDLAMLVYQVEFNKDMKLKLGHSIDRGELTDDQKDCLNELKRKYHDRMQKVLNVINPALGEQWREILFSLDYERADSIVGIEKLNLIAISSVSIEKKLAWLRLLESPKGVRQTRGMPSTNAEFRVWLSREVLLDMIEKNAIRILDSELSILKAEGGNMELPSEPTLASYFGTIRSEGRKYVYGNIKKKGSKEKTKKKEDGPLQSVLDAASCRLIYRFLLQLKEARVIETLPSFTSSWLDVQNESTMYEESMRLLSNYEIRECPWWIDCMAPNILPREREKYEAWKTGCHLGGFQAMKGGANPHHVLRRDKRPKEATKAKEDSAKEKRMGGSLEKAVVEEIMDFQEDEMSPLRNTDKAFHMPPKVGSSVTTSMYVPPKGASTSIFLSPSFYACGVGDYICMGMDFHGCIRNEQYGAIHAFFSSLDKQGVTCTRKKKTSAWAAHFVLLDLPMGSHVAPDGVPSWNVLTEDHVRHGLGVAGACLDDMGWIVCISSISGDSPSWVEKYAPKSELEVVHRFTVEDVEYKGFVTHKGFSFEMDAFYTFVLRRIGSCATPQRDTGDVLFARHVLRHYLPGSARTVEAGDKAIYRAGVQRSVGFIQGLLEALCVPRGLALEMGSGTAPLLRACMNTGRPCFSFDIDERVVATILRPLVACGPSLGHEVSRGEVGDDSDPDEDAYADPWASN